MVKCEDCPLYLTATNMVLGVGNSTANYFFVGEAPGQEEDRKGEPFVGSAGKVLDKVLAVTNLSRDDIYLTNVVKHRPPKNRKPLAKEIKACSRHLESELVTVKPKVIVTLGDTAGKVFIKKLRLKGEHGRARVVEKFGLSFIVIPWFHPAATLYDPRLISLMLEDARRLESEVVNVGKPQIQHNYRLINKPEELREYLDGSEIVGLDTETTSPQRGKVFQTDDARLVGLSTSRRADEAVYYVGGSVASSLNGRRFVCHNAKFEYKVLKKEGYRLSNFDDTKLAAYLLQEPSTHLKDLTRQVLRREPITYEQVSGGKDMSELTPEAIVTYACMDADHTLQLWSILQDRLKKEGLFELYQNTELPLVEVLAEMEEYGVKIDRAKSLLVLNELQRLQATSESNVNDLLPNHINVASHQQLAKELDNLGAPIKQRTEKKQLLKLDDFNLKKVRLWHPELIDAILGFRKYQKLAGYVSSWLELADDNDIIHASFNQAGAWEEIGNDSRNAPSTGRLSSSGPNLQNIPHHSDKVWGERLRNLIVSRPGRIFLAADLEQEEPRIIAHVARDETLTKAFADGRDIYRRATESIYPSTLSQLDDGEWKRLCEEERYRGKTFFLAWYYGANEGTLVKNIDVEMKMGTAQTAIKRLALAHPARQQYIADVKAELIANGFVVDMFGRKRWIPKIYAKGRKLEEEAIREAANFKIQGAAGSILKQSMRKVFDAIQGLTIKIVMTIHDELVFELEPKDIDKLKSIVLDSFSQYPFALPVSFKVGERWGEMRAV